MTGEELAKLPVGTLIKHCGDTGEIVQAGRTTHIMFPGVGTILVDTASKAWQSVMDEMEVEEF
jgi:hypothetical protein